MDGSAYAQPLPRTEEGNGRNHERALEERSRGLRLASVGGIPLRIDTSWLVIFLLVAWAAATYFPRIVPGVTVPVALVMGIVASLVLFASIVVHELSHSLVARALGYEVHSITLFVFGGVSEIGGEPRTARDEAAISIVGPLSSFALAGALEGARIALSPPPAPAAVLDYLAMANMAVAVFNMFPGFPLDGGRVLRATFRALGDGLLRATRKASLVGQGLGFGLMGLGALSFLLGGGLGGIWLALVGWFLRNSADASYRQLAFRSRIEHLRASDAAEHVVPLDPDDDVELALLGRGLLGSDLTRYPVVRDGRLVGMLDTAALRAVPRAQWTAVRVSALEPRIEASVLPGASLLEALERMLGERRHEIAVADEQGSFVGMIRFDDVARLARAERAAPAPV